MKIQKLILPVLASAFLIPGAFAEDPPAGAKCEMMKKPAATAEAAAAEAAAQQAELEKLVAEMNSNIGPKKIEAMAAILTRLVEQSKANLHHAQKAPAADDAAKAHQH